MKEEAKREKEIKWKSEKDKKEFKGKKIKDIEFKGKERQKTFLVDLNGKRNIWRKRRIIYIEGKRQTGNERAKVAKCICTKISSCVCVHRSSLSCLIGHHMSFIYFTCSSFKVIFVHCINKQANKRVQQPSSLICHVLDWSSRSSEFESRQEWQTKLKSYL